MRRGRGNVWGVWILVCVMAVMAGRPLTVFGATKTVSSITIRVGTDTKAGEMLNENIAVYANTTAVQSGTYAATSSERYSLQNAEWSSSTKKAMTVGEEPRMKLYLEIEDTDYAFRGSYSSSNIIVKGGTFMSARKSSSGKLEVTVRLNGIKGSYKPPVDARWRETGFGRAEWTEEKSEGVSSGYYDVYLYRGNAVVKKLEDYQGTSYNFYPYMTQKGTYKYKVRTVPYTEVQKKYGQKSEWLDSDEIYIAKEDVSDGSGRSDVAGAPPTGNTRVGWQYLDNYWYYYYPDGTCQKDSWLKVQDKWYLFQGDGKMLRGWQKKGDHTYFLSENGDMQIGWVQKDGRWRYLNPTPDAYEGAMFQNQWADINGKAYYFNGDGVMMEGWNQVGGNWYYFYPGEGYKAVNTWIDTFYVDENGVWKR